MNPEFKEKTTKEKIEVMQAFERGEEIEAEWFDGYIAIKHPSWNWQSTNYRVKPKPTTKTIYFAVFVNYSGGFRTSPLYENKENYDAYLSGVKMCGLKVIKEHTLEVQF